MPVRRRSLLTVLIARLRQTNARLPLLGRPLATFFWLAPLLFWLALLLFWLAPLLGWLSPTGLLAGEPAGDVAPIDFNRQIRPILSDHCFNCHGPDSGTLQSGLRLDVAEGALGSGDSGATAVVPYQPDQSELVRRILSDDDGERMPPSDFNKPLSESQQQLLQQWVQQGAVWQGHWAFEPIGRPAVPPLVDDAGQPLTSGPGNNPIDAFVRQRLQATGLAPAAGESPERLLRRLSLDLTGLPPTPEEVWRYLQDSSPNAYEKQVDRLLASPHFGERMALPWLDLARYGDTSGYHNDSFRDMWLWRQWVIEALNANMPFDQFTTEQLAGDLLPEATIQQRVASGFHRNVMTSDEGGLIDEEYLNLYVVDRTSTTGVTWMGLTVACAQCHDHKYDPLSQADFYRLYAFFNNIAENGKDGVRDRNPVPFLRVPTAAMQAELDRLQAAVDAATQAQQQLEQSLAQQQIAWEDELRRRPALPAPAVAAVHFPLDQDGVAIDGRGESAMPLPPAGPLDAANFSTGVVGQAFDTNADSWFHYPDVGDYERDQPFSVAAFVRVTAAGGAPLGRMDDAQAARGWDLEFHGRRPSVHLIHRWPDNVIHVQANEDLPEDQFTSIAWTYDGSATAAGLRLYVDGRPAAVTVQADRLTDTIRTETPFAIGRRGPHSTNFTGGIDEVRLYDRVLTAEEVAVLAGGDDYRWLAIDRDQRSDDQQARVDRLYRASQGATIARAATAVDEARKAFDAYQASLPNTMVMQERDELRETFIKVRGQYDLNGDRVTAGTPDFLPPLQPRRDDGRADRLDLARWLVDRDNPLTARVTINRWWAMLFGNGLVATVNDFGAQGEPPSHPELLDWLADDLMGDWDTKRAIKQIVSSATYRQSSRQTAEMLASDHDNRLLARGPRRRLEAELIRDNALSIAGLITRAIGGQSIKPYQPPGTWEINEMSGATYDTSSGADLYRRGLYIYWRRSTVYPSMITLDAPTREFCVAQRAITSTPLQALVLMNDPVFVEAARAMAQRLLDQPGDDRQRLHRAWRLALARPPTEAETAILEQQLAQRRQAFQTRPAAAAELLTVGELAVSDGLDAVELAAWTAVCGVILNLNETISN